LCFFFLGSGQHKHFCSDERVTLGLLSTAEAKVEVVLVDFAVSDSSPSSKSDSWRKPKPESDMIFAPEAPTNEDE